MNVPQRYSRGLILAWSVIGGLSVSGIDLAAHMIAHDTYPGDYVWALRTAYTLVHGIDPYAFSANPAFVPYPLPVALFGFPLLWTHTIGYLTLGSPIFMGVSAALLVWAMLRAGEVARLFCVLLSPPFWAAVYAGQWSPIIVAAAFLPALAPLLTLVKPQIALPVLLTRCLSWRGAGLAAVVLAVSLLIDPGWPWEFLTKIGPYQGTIPALILPFGPLLLLMLLRWRDPSWRLLALMAIMPQRAIYDLLGCWLVPSGNRPLAVLTVLSWLALAPELLRWPDLFATPDIRLGALVLYGAAMLMLILPMLKAPSILRNHVA